MSTVIEQSPPQGRLRTGLASVRHSIELSKPSIVRMCLIMTAGGFWLAPAQVEPLIAMFAMIGTALTVGGANALNMWWERDLDGRMERTRSRPLPSGRLQPKAVLQIGLVLSVLGLAALVLGTNLLTAGLGLFALLSYVLIYTPLKLVTPLSLVIGAVPGAMPPLMGWTAATNQLDGAGLLLFAILLCWQIPHFIAISIFRKDDYDRAGVQIVPTVRGMNIAMAQSIAWSVALLATSLLLWTTGTTGLIYLAIASVSGAVFLIWAIVGIWAKDKVRWARQLFFVSLFYLPAIAIALALDKTF